jgi:hypothetical protein
MKPLVEKAEIAPLKKNRIRARFQVSTAHNSPTESRFQLKIKRFAVASARAKGVTLGLRQQFSNIDVNKLNIIAQCTGGE